MSKRLGKAEATSSADRTRSTRPVKQLRRLTEALSLPVRRESPGQESHPKPARTGPKSNPVSDRPLEDPLEVEPLNDEALASATL